jgi:hypothetical protein
MPDLIGGVGTAVADAGAADAAAAGEGAGGAAGGEGGGDAGAGGAGGAGGEAGGAEAGDAAAGEGAPTDLEAEPEADFDPEAEGIDADGRKLDLKTREALAAFKKANPEAAKRLAGTYFRANTIVKEIGAANLSDAIVKVRNMAATFDSLGGEEGITGLQTKVADYDREIDQFANGDPALLHELNESNPDAFITSITNGLEIIASKNPKGLDRVLFPAMVARLETAGMFKTVADLAALIKDGKGQEAYDLTAEISKWLEGSKAFAEKQKTLKLEKNPEADKLSRERADLDKAKRDHYEGQVGTDVNRQNNTATASIVEPFFKELKLKPEGRREFVNSLNSRIWAAMKKDAAFQRNAKALMDKGDVTRAARFIHSKFAELLPENFRRLRDVLYPNYKPGPVRKVAAGAAGNGAAAGAGGARAAAGGAAAGAGANGATLVTKMPRPEEIDWGKTTEDMYHIGRGTGEAVLKNGKRIRFDWSKVER